LAISPLYLFALFQFSFNYHSKQGTPINSKMADLTETLLACQNPGEFGNVI
jgi:hypothetical protein